MTVQICETVKSGCVGIGRTPGVPPPLLHKSGTEYNFFELIIEQLFRDDDQPGKHDLRLMISSDYRYKSLDSSLKGDQWSKLVKNPARIKVQIRPSQTDQHYRAVLSLLKLGYILFVANTSKACLRQIEKYQFSKVKRVNASLHAGAHIEDSKVPAKEENLEIEAMLFLLHPQLFFCQTIIFALRKPPRHKWLYPSLSNLDFYAVLCLYERFTPLWWAIVCKWSWFILLHFDLKIAKCQFAKKKRVETNNSREMVYTFNWFCLHFQVKVGTWQSVHVCRNGKRTNWTKVEVIDKYWKIWTKMDNYGQRSTIVDKYGQR